MSRYCFSHALTGGFLRIDPISFFMSQSRFSICKKIFQLYPIFTCFSLVLFSIWIYAKNLHLPEDFLLKTLLEDTSFFIYRKSPHFFPNFQRFLGKAIKYLHIYPKAHPPGKAPLNRVLSAPSFLPKKCPIPFLPKGARFLSSPKIPKSFSTKKCPDPAKQDSGTKISG